MLLTERIDDSLAPSSHGLLGSHSCPPEQTHPTTLTTPAAAAACAETEGGQSRAPPPLEPLVPIPAPQELDAYRISPAAFLDLHRETLDRAVVGAVVFDDHRRGADDSGGSDDDGEPRVLLIQRAEKDYAGLCWEIPGGVCEVKEDASMLEAARRELLEETALEAARISAVVEDCHEWVDVGLRWRKMTFIAEVVGAGPGARGGGSAAAEVGLDPREHQDHVWATRREVLADRCDGRDLVWTSPEQKATVVKAFDVLEGVAGDSEARGVGA